MRFIGVEIAGRYGVRDIDESTVVVAATAVLLGDTILAVEAPESGVNPAIAVTVKAVADLLVKQAIAKIIVHAGLASLANDLSLRAIEIDFTDDFYLAGYGKARGVFSAIAGTRVRHALLQVFTLVILKSFAEIVIGAV